MNNSVLFDAFMMWCKHHLYLLPKQPIAPKETLSLPRPPAAPSSCVRLCGVTASGHFVSMTKEPLENWLLSLSVMFSSLVHTIADSSEARICHQRWKTLRGGSHLSGTLRPLPGFSP